MDTQEFKIDGIILIARPCIEPEVTSQPSVEESYTVFLEGNAEDRVGVIMKSRGVYRVFCDPDGGSYSQMDFAVRRVLEIFNEELEPDEDTAWDDITAQLGEMGIHV